MIRTARLALALALAAMLVLAATAAARTPAPDPAVYAQAPDDGDDASASCEADDACSDEDSGETPWECEPEDQPCDELGEDGDDEGWEETDEATLPAAVKRPGKPVKVKRAKVTLAAVCEPEEGCVAATYTLTVKGQKLTTTDRALAAGESTRLVFKLSRRQLRKLGKRAVKATVSAPGLPAARIKLRG